MTEEFKCGDIIRVLLPGEGMWAKFMGRLKVGRYRGHVRVLLQNQSLHKGFSWGQSVIIDDDHYVITPKAAVKAAELVVWGCDRKTHEQQVVEAEKEDDRRHEVMMQEIEKVKIENPELWEEINKGLDDMSNEGKGEEN